MSRDSGTTIVLVIVALGLAWFVFFRKKGSSIAAQAQSLFDAAAQVRANLHLPSGAGVWSKNGLPVGGNNPALLSLPPESLPPAAVPGWSQGDPGGSYT